MRPPGRRPRSSTRTRTPASWRARAHATPEMPAPTTVTGAVTRRSCRMPGVPATVVVTDPGDPRLADFRDLVSGDRPAGGARGGRAGGGPGGARGGGAAALPRP